ncbi:MAG: transposase, partial [Myxococcales bacterium]|nr:transposase [Myxococcales bacterium]
LISTAAIAEKIAYAIVNPVACGAVPSAPRWPGVKVLPEQTGNLTLEARRPEVYFDPQNPEWPETLQLEVEMPRELLAAHGDADAARHAIAAEVKRLEREARAKMRRLGHGFGTPQSAVQTKITRRARSFEFFGVLDPTFAAAGDTDAALAIIERNRSFHRDHATCLTRHRQGESGIIWPAGTWKMHVARGMPRRAPP